MGRAAKKAMRAHWTKRELPFFLHINRVEVSHQSPNAFPKFLSTCATRAPLYKPPQSVPHFARMPSFAATPLLSSSSSIPSFVSCGLADTDKEHGGASAGLPLLPDGGGARLVLSAQPARGAEAGHAPRGARRRRLRH